MFTVVKQISFEINCPGTTACPSYEKRCIITKTTRYYITSTVPSCCQDISFDSCKLVSRMVSN